MKWARWLLLPAMLACAEDYALAAAASVGIDVARQQALIHLVRQDCGSCHGLTLHGGLGPPLTATALSQRSPESMEATILQGHPGTPMPPFRGLIGEQDARWIAQQLLTGFPEEH